MAKVHVLFLGLQEEVALFPNFPSSFWQTQHLLVFQKRICATGVVINKHDAQLLRVMDNSSFFFYRHRKQSPSLIRELCGFINLDSCLESSCVLYGLGEGSAQHISLGLLSSLYVTIETKLAQAEGGAVHSTLVFRCHGYESIAAEGKTVQLNHQSSSSGTIETPKLRTPRAGVDYHCGQLDGGRIWNNKPNESDFM